jgi:hypothetical protein
MIESNQIALDLLDQAGLEVLLQSWKLAKKDTM